MLRAPALVSRPTSFRSALSASWALPNDFSSRLRAAGDLLLWRLRVVDFAAVRLRAVDFAAGRLRALDRDPDFAAAMVNSLPLVGWVNQPYAQSSPRTISYLQRPSWPGPAAPLCCCRSSWPGPAADGTWQRQCSLSRWPSSPDPAGGLCPARPFSPGPG